MDLCLRTDRRVLTTFEAVLTGADGETLQAWPLPGIPSRARIGDGMLSTTAFVTGHSYAPTTFSTQTVIRSLDPAVPDPGDLESFALSVAGAPLTAADRPLWGVTFADDGDTFYATAASGSRTWLVRESMSARTMTAIHDTTECPSLSPDEIFGVGAAAPEPFSHRSSGSLNVVGTVPRAIFRTQPDGKKDACPCPVD